MPRGWARLWARLFHRGPSHLRVGRQGERAAARFLRRKRYTILERNTRLPSGELDLVCLAPDRCTVVVVEVKTRKMKPDSSVESFMPELHINPAKRGKLRSLTHSLRQNRGWLDRPIRIDVVAIDLNVKGRPTVRHYENAV